MSTDPTAGTTGQAAQASTETWCERFPNEGHAWSYTHHAGPARIETRTCTLCGYLSVEPITARFASLTSENARLRQQRNEARKERDATVELAQTQLEGWRKTRAERDEACEGWATLAGIAEEVAQQLEAKDSRRVRRSWAAKELREAVETFGPKAAPSATETAPQTPPGVTGHTEAPTTPSEAHGGPEGAALIAATEQEIRDLGADDPAGVEQLIGQRNVWRETAQTLARKVDERPGHNDDCGSCCCCSIDTDRLRADLAAAEQRVRDLEQQLAEARAETERVRHVYREHLTEAQRRIHELLTPTGSDIAVLGGYVIHGTQPTADTSQESTDG